MGRLRRYSTLAAIGIVMVAGSRVAAAAEADPQRIYDDVYENCMRGHDAIHYYSICSEQAQNAKNKALTKMNERLAVTPWPTCTWGGNDQYLAISAMPPKLIQDYACQKVQIAVNLQVAADGKSARIDRPFVQAGFVNHLWLGLNLDHLSSEAAGELRQKCPDYAACIARWKITFLRHNDNWGPGMAFDFASLDGWDGPLVAR